jgi:hypothetical protein
MTESDDMMRQHICAVHPEVHYGRVEVMDSATDMWVGIRLTDQAKKDYL